MYNYYKLLLLQRKAVEIQVVFEGDNYSPVYRVYDDQELQFPYNGENIIVRFFKEEDRIIVHSLGFVSQEVCCVSRIKGCVQVWLHIDRAYV